eukprot:scaffold120871_cov36-Cyclotella_meneghiniana.AAC.1
MHDLRYDLWMFPTVNGESAGGLARSCPPSTYPRSPLTVHLGPSLVHGPPSTVHVHAPPPLAL